MSAVGVKEREIKLSISDVDGAKKTLLLHGFEFEGSCLDWDVYYAHPCRDFAKSDEALRFRRRVCGSLREYEVTYKGPRAKGGVLKVREELEVRVDESTWYLLRAIVERLGFALLAEFTKERDLYRARGLEASVDTLYGVGYFVEIELQGDVEETRLTALLRDLEKSSGARIVDKTYLEICLETGKCKGLE